jgi:beta-phosphoglucomutase
MTSMPTITHTSLEIAGIPGIRAAVFDFNGTITSDEEQQYQVYAEIFYEEAGIRLSQEYYESRLASLTDPEIITAVLEQSGMTATTEAISRIGKLRVARYIERAVGSPPVRPGVVALMHELARHIPLAVVTGAPEAEVSPILSASGLDSLLVTVVTSDEVTNGKPNPEGYLLGLQRLRVALPDLLASEVVVFEDSVVGLAAARTAGLKCVAVPLSPGTISLDADYVADVLDERILLPPARGRI